MTWFCVVNPQAGRGGSPIDEILTEMDNLGIDAVVRESRSPEHLSALVGESVNDGFTDFISVGGDGTANLVINELLRSPTVRRARLAIVAVGSGSDFVRTFGHRRGVREGLERVVGDAPNLYTVDVGLVSGAFGERHFLNALNVGVAAASVATADKLPRSIGSVRYTAGFWIALWRFANASIALNADSHRFAGDAINVVVANGQFFGGGLNIAPRSILGDGKMDVQVFLGPRRQAFSVMPRVIRGSHLSHKGVRRYSAGAITIDVPDHWPVEVDGELIGRGRVEVEVLPSRIDMVI